MVRDRGMTECRRQQQQKRAELENCGPMRKSLPWLKPLKHHELNS